jgi:hypothetical protein
VAEVRPWVGAQVTVARVKINRDIEIIDFTNETPVGRFPGANFPGSESGAETIWRELLSYAISIPLQPNHSVNYVPTQYFAEVLKANGVGGIKYKSSLNPKGFNLTIFDPFVGQVTSTRLIAVSGVTYKYEPAKRRLARKPKETKGSVLDAGQIEQVIEMNILVFVNILEEDQRIHKALAIERNFEINPMFGIIL